MRFAAILLSCALLACGGPPAGDEQSADLSGSCGGLKPAHCFCKVEGGPVLTTGSPDSIIPIHIEGQELFTYRIPGKCYNQQADLWSSHFGGGCWKDCRDAFGVEGHPRDSGVTQLIQDASRTLRALGACGGWMSAPLSYAAGTGKFRAATAVGIGIGIGGTVVTVNGRKECR